MLELTAADLDGTHLGKLASAAWESCWMQPVPLKTFESVWRTEADGSQALIQRTLVFANGAITTNHPSKLKVRIYQP